MIPWLGFIYIDWDFLVGFSGILSDCISASISKIHYTHLYRFPFYRRDRASLNYFISELFYFYIISLKNNVQR